MARYRRSGADRWRRTRSWRALGVRICFKSMRLRLQLVLLLVPSALAAQQPAAANPIADTFRSFSHYGRWLIAAFDSIPASKYDFKPTASQQSVGYIAQHLEYANYGLCEVLGGVKHARTQKDVLADTIKAKWPKDTLVARVRASLVFCRDALAPLTDAQLGEPVTLTLPGRPAESFPRARYAILLLTDLAEHYAQLASYMRLLGMTSRSAREWADLVRKASSHRGPWPRVSVWHGNDDKTVIPSNALEILKQWTEIHGLPLPPSVKTRVDGFPREVWIDEAGDELIEAYTITNMAHGTPLAIGEAEGACGAPGPFLLPVGISSSYHIAKFFGIAVARASVERNMVTLSPAPHQIKGAEPVLEGEILDKDDEPIRQQEPTPPLPDIGAIINNALRAAGLIKD